MADRPMTEGSEGWQKVYYGIRPCGCNHDRYAYPYRRHRQKRGTEYSAVEHRVARNDWLPDTVISAGHGPQSGFNRNGQGRHYAALPRLFGGSPMTRDNEPGNCRWQRAGEPKLATNAEAEPLYCAKALTVAWRSVLLPARCFTRTVSLGWHHLTPVS